MVLSGMYDLCDIAVSVESVLWCLMVWGWRQGNWICHDDADRSVHITILTPTLTTINIMNIIVIMIMGDVWKLLLNDTEPVCPVGHVTLGIG